VAGTSAIGLRWLGHACVQIDLAGVRVLTDPALTPRLAHLRRHHRVGAIDPPDAILVSHVHMDHLHIPSLRVFSRDVPIIVPAGAGRLVRRAGFRDVRETRVGGSLEVGALQIETVPAVHPSRRGPHSRVEADAVGYVLRAAGAAVYFPGDTDVSMRWETWAPVDVALLPIGGWGRTVGEGHLDPRRAVAAAELLQPRLVVPVHWGTYSPIGLRRPSWLDEPAGRFAAELAAVGAGDRLRMLRPGEGLVVPSDPPIAGSSGAGPGAGSAS
jgi:L-ascorbate metabolism protein UlaG (beta-lactamase superfamily)